MSKKIHWKTKQKNLKRLKLQQEYPNLARFQPLLCPECGAELKECVGEHNEKTFAGVKCPSGCNLCASGGL